MKVNIEIDASLPQDEVTLRCAALTEDVLAIRRKIESAPPRLVFYKEDREYFFSPGDILFFETEGDAVWAHTANDAYRVHKRLYELEGELPRAFIRAAKSAIVNTGKIYAIRREALTGGQISFLGTHKQIYVSRRYYGVLRQRILERGL